GHDDAIPLQDDDIAQGPLPKTSWVRATKLFSLNRDSVVLKLGNLKPEAFKRIHGGICARLGCAEEVALNDIAGARAADGKSPVKVQPDEL
ncbi:MAG: hypothetical protein PHH11_18005, partial [Methylomonas sp.]|nr:hypothetical protein [Methylomonas sp.]